MLIHQRYKKYTFDATAQIRQGNFYSVFAKSSIFAILVAAKTYIIK